MQGPFTSPGAGVQVPLPRMVHRLRSATSRLIPAATTPHLPCHDLLLCGVLPNSHAPKGELLSLATCPVAWRGACNQTSRCHCTPDSIKHFVAPVAIRL